MWNRLCSKNVRSAARCSAWLIRRQDRGTKRPPIDRILVAFGRAPLGCVSLLAGMNVLLGLPRGADGVARDRARRVDPLLGVSRLAVAEATRSIRIDARGKAEGENATSSSSPHCAYREPRPGSQTRFRAGTHSQSGPVSVARQDGAMRWITLLLALINAVLADRSRLALENAALRHQLAVLKRSVTRAKFDDSDRVF